MQAGDFPRGGIFVHDALLRPAHDFRLRGAEGLFRRGQIAGLDGPLHLAHEGAHPRFARLVDQGAAPRLPHGLLGGFRIRHGLFRLPLCERSCISSRRARAPQSPPPRSGSSLRREIAATSPKRPVPTWIGTGLACAPAYTGQAVIRQLASPHFSPSPLPTRQRGFLFSRKAAMPSF